MQHIFVANPDRKQVESPSHAARHFMQGIAL